MLVGFRKEVEEMPAELFAQHCESLAQKKLSPPRSLNELADTWFKEIGNRNYLWDRPALEAAALRALALPDLLAFFDKHFSATSSDRAKFTALVVGADGRAAGAVADKSDAVDSVWSCPKGSCDSWDTTAMAQCTSQPLPEFKTTATQF
mmetsp:Transcript_2345/g.6368  ORF Transcript_2345/g.6368 Transcript_2345/m.6368 type:complete len:149 (-) Transcript_2345:29-475(-)